MPCAGLIVNDGKDLAIETADRIEARLTEAGWDVVRASSSGGMVGFANPDQSLRLLGYAACVPPGFTSSAGQKRLESGVRHSSMSITSPSSRPNSNLVSAMTMPRSRA